MDDKKVKTDETNETTNETTSSNELNKTDKTNQEVSPETVSDTKEDQNKASDSKAGILKKITAAALVIVIAVSGILIISDYISGKKGETNYESLAEMVKSTAAETIADVIPQTEEETETAYVSPIDFDTLLAINPDTVGWIKIPGTNVDYPIVFKEGDNDTYLDTDFEGNKNIMGAIYLDMDSTPDFSGRNNIIYGHNMKNGCMFKDVISFKEEEYFKEHQFFEIYTPERTIRLKAVSCYYDEAKPIARKTRFKTRESYDAFIRAMLAPCTYAEIPDVPIDSLYTLITCSYEIDDARTFLFAVEVDENGEIIEAENPDEGFLADEEGLTGESNGE